MIRLVKFLKLFGVFFLMVSLLNGCGGGGDGDATADGTQIGEGINIVSFTLTSGNTNVEEVPINDSASVKIRLLDGNNQPIQSVFVSAAATLGTASTPPATDVNGEASFTITAPTALASSRETAQLTLTYGDYTKSHQFQFVSTQSTDSQSVNQIASISFVSATPQYLSLKGTGGLGLSEQSKVVFKAVDASGLAIEGATINFTLPTSLGGLSLSASQAVTDSNGEAFTYVQAGTEPTAVRVTAYLSLSDGSTLSVQSDALGIATGIPDQNSFEITLSQLAPQGLQYSGEIVTVTARVADRNNNPVPDGTTVYFTTEGGSISPTCQTSSGACSSVWTSQNPRPTDHRVTIEAHVIGHETFYDREGGENGVFDNIDVFDDLAEAFRDDDENGTYNPSATNGFTNDFARDEKYQDYNGSNTFSTGDGLYNGIPCKHPTNCPTNANNLAENSNFLIHVRASKVLIMAANHPNISLYQITSGSSCLDSNGHISTANCTNVAGSTVNFSTGTQTLSFWVMLEDTAAKCQVSSSDATRVDSVNPNSSTCTYAIRQSVPTGSSVSVTSDVGQDISGVPEGSISSTLSHREFVISITSQPDNTDINSGFLEIELTTPKGEKTSASVTLVDPIN